MATLVLDPDYGLDAPELASAPGTPASSRRRLYAKGDGWYDLDDTGTERKLAAGTLDHGDLAGLGDDDHPQYAQVAAAETVTGLFTFDRDPDPPFAVASGSDVVANLDADLLDGQHASAFAASDHNHDTNGVRTKTSTADFSNPPTDAELDAEFGTPATVGEGFMAGIDDNGAGTDGYLVMVINGAWWVFTGLKAV
jgi:hypothetical protein